MSSNYTVLAGDTLIKIAKKFGKPSWQAIYYSPENDAFRLKRPNPNLIYSGDVIVIPDVGGPSVTPTVGTSSPPVPGQASTGWDEIIASEPWMKIKLDARTVRFKVWKRNFGEIDESALYAGPASGVLSKYARIDLNTAAGVANFQGWIATVIGAVKPGIVLTGGFQTQPGEQEGFRFIGKVVIARSEYKITKVDDPANGGARASLSYFEDASRSPYPGENFCFNLGVPPGGADYALGGLVPIIDNGKPGPKDTNVWKNAGGARVGRTVVAKRDSDNLLLLAVQADPHQTLRRSPNAVQGPPERYLTPTEIQKELLDEGYDNAVFLDGSDSVFLDYLGARCVDPSHYKQCVNQTVVSFEKKGS